MKGTLEQYEEFKALCRLAKIAPPPICFIQNRVKIDGEEILYPRELAHSWTRNYWNYHFTMASSYKGEDESSFEAGYMTGKTTGGLVGGGTGSKNYGQPTIIIGTGDTAFDIDQYVLATAIADGSGSGQMTHQTVSNGSMSYNSGTDVWSFETERDFINNSGAQITVKEAGFTVLCEICKWNDPCLMARDVLAAAVDVPNGGILTVTYTVEADFSSIDT